MEKSTFKEIKEKRTDYASMIDFCCDSLILNNEIMPELQKNGFEFDLYCGTDYNDETDEFAEIYQNYLISERDAERLAEYTNEIVFYNEALDIYILAVTHFGTAWHGVAANWKNESEIEE